MSTKLSTDLHITRPTTRLHAPPGGTTSITFGDGSLPLPPAAHNPRNVSGGKDTLVLGDQTAPPQPAHNPRNVSGGKDTLVLGDQFSTTPRKAAAVAASG